MLTQVMKLGHSSVKERLANNCQEENAVGSIYPSPTVNVRETTGFIPRGGNDIPTAYVLIDNDYELWKAQ